MRLALLAAVSTVAGLGACAPLAPGGGSYGYGYTGVQQAQPSPYGYYDGGYAAPGPYYEQPGYAAPYVAPGPTIIVGGERRFDDRDRYRRYNRPENERGYRGNPNQPPPGREYGGQPGRENNGQPGRQYTGARPGPAPVPAPRQNPVGPSPMQQAPGPSGHAPDFNPANPGAHGGADR